MQGSVAIAAAATVAAQIPTFAEDGGTPGPATISTASGAPTLMGIIGKTESQQD